mmetsp:Transcript_45186/g.45764  ORF Transcript_45186/g.45764 Transcript_45186/m.45764 type:complete len:263 (+) Transcript_45186:118-906(+)
MTMATYHQATNDDDNDNSDDDASVASDSLLLPLPFAIIDDDNYVDQFPPFVTPPSSCRNRNNSKMIRSIKEEEEKDGEIASVSRQPPLCYYDSSTVLPDLLMESMMTNTSTSTSTTTATPTTRTTTSYHPELEISTSNLFIANDDDVAPFKSNTATNSTVQNLSLLPAPLTPSTAAMLALSSSLLPSSSFYSDSSPSSRLQSIYFEEKEKEEEKEKITRFAIGDASSNSNSTSLSILPFIASPSPPSLSHRMMTYQLRQKSL